MISQKLERGFKLTSLLVFCFVLAAGCAGGAQHLSAAETIRPDGNDQPETVPNPPEANDLNWWVGKSPATVYKDQADQEAPHGNIWDLPKVRQSMQLSLGKSYFDQLLKGWGVGWPLVHGITKVNDDTIAFFACRQHCCPCNGVTVFINTKTTDVQACGFQNDYLSPVQIEGYLQYWLSAAGKKDLDGDDCLNERNLPKLYEKYRTKMSPAKLN